ncbi:hypothetical protein [Leisingera caerulea]|uniref:hypothetical protein n=1 Tax=Leisingera caerulea TaxID=506591 RepID=UPI0003FEDD54|nr:hypothetical protein [Leisingera caerulea]
MNAHTPASLDQSREAGALPPSLRYRDIQRTGQFLHEGGLKHHLFFEGEGEVPRSFTVLIALGYKANEQENLDLGRNGIAVIDNDNWRIVADSCLQQASGLKGASREQRKLLAEIREMDWQSFVSFCRSQKTYRAGSPDLDQAASQPDCGSIGNQVQLGLRHMEEVDERSEFVKTLHETGEYNLPKVSRDGMIKDLMIRQSQEADAGRMLSWDIGMDFKWDSSGHIDGGQDLSAQLDTRWRRAMRDEPEILSDAVQRAMAPYTSDGFNVLDLGESAACDLKFGGPDDRYLMLSAFGGQDMSFGSFRELNTKLKNLATEDLLNLWTTVRVLDKDLSRSCRSYDVAWELNAIRSEREERWLNEVEEEISFAV